LAEPKKIEPLIEPTPIDNKPAKKAWLLFELGALEVFYFYSEIAVNSIDTSKVYWRKKDGLLHYGPFPSIYHAMKHYAWYEQLDKGQVTERRDAAPNNIISITTRKPVDPK